jgi:hypothetical protein
VMGTGARWGLDARIQVEPAELSVAGAAARYATFLTDASLLYPAAVMDHLPGRKQRLFDSYAAWFAGVSEWVPHALTPDRVGIRQIRLGVYVALNSRVSRYAVLRSPCWIGEGVFVGARCVVGPHAFLENHSYLEADVEVSHSHIGPGTFIGRYSVLQQSLAWDSTLVNWQTGGARTVTDLFARTCPGPGCSLNPGPFSSPCACPRSGASAGWRVASDRGSAG